MICWVQLATGLEQLVCGSYHKTLIKPPSLFRRITNLSPICQRFGICPALGPSSPLLDGDRCSVGLVHLVAVHRILGNIHVQLFGPPPQSKAQSSNYFFKRNILFLTKPKLFLTKETWDPNNTPIADWSSLAPFNVKLCLLPSKFSGMGILASTRSFSYHGHG